MAESGSKKVILINGLPATGKTMLARRIQAEMQIPLLSLDTIKEALFDVLGIGDREYNRKLGRATKQVIWSVIGNLPDGATVLVDAWFGFPPYTLVTDGLARAGASRAVELWCHAPGELLAQRYVERVDQRHKGHPGREYAAELIEVAKRATPMGLFPVYDLEMSHPEQIDVLQVVKWIEGEFAEKAMK
jgi:glucokinase